MSGERAMEMLNSAYKCIAVGTGHVLHFEQSQSLSLKSTFQYSLYLMRLFASVCRLVVLIKVGTVLETDILSQKNSPLLIFFFQEKLVNVEPYL